MTRDEKILALKPAVNAQVRYAARRLPPYVDSGDLIGPAWVGAIEAVDRCDGRAIRNYACGLIRGRIKDYMRREDPLSRSHRKAVQSGSEESPVAYLDHEPTDDRENRIIDRIHVQELLTGACLTDRETIFVAMRYWDGMSHHEIANEIHVSDSRVSQISEGVIAKIRAFLKVEDNMANETYSRTGDIYTCQECACATKVLNGPKHSPGCPHIGMQTLPPREAQVARLLADGKSLKAIGAELKIATKTVETTKYHLMRRLGIHNLAALVRLVVADENERKAAELMKVAG